MSRRHTFSNPSSDYPEHLNPFREDVTQDEGKENQVNGFRRRNSRLTASFRLNNWPMFSKKSKGSESSSEDGTPTKPKSSKFSTLTPRLSRHIIDVLSPKKGKEKEAPIPQYNTLPVRRPPADPVKEFILIKPNRERFAPRVQTTEPVVEPRPSREPPVPEPRVSLPPVPLPRTSLSRAGSTTLEPLEEVATTTTTTTTLSQVITESERVVEEEDSRYIRQGARPKKKRQAPLPPSSPAPQINHRESEASENTATHPSASTTRDCASETHENTSLTTHESASGTHASTTVTTHESASGTHENTLLTTHESASETHENTSLTTHKSASGTHASPLVTTHESASGTHASPSVTTHESASVTHASPSMTTHESASVTHASPSMTTHESASGKQEEEVDTHESTSITREIVSVTLECASVSPPSASVRQKKAAKTRESASVTPASASETRESASGTGQESNPGSVAESSLTPSIDKPVTLAMEEIDFSVKLYIDDDL